MQGWSRMYNVLSEYPEYFSEDSISMSAYEWVYVLLTNRCFSSPWMQNCQMVPFADTINHENTDVHYECCDLQGKPIEESQKVRKAQR